MSENILVNILHSLYPASQIDHVGQTKETGDVILSRKDKNFFCLRFVLQWGQTIFSSSIISSNWLEHAGHIKPSNAIIFSKNQGRKYIFTYNNLQEV